MSPMLDRCSDELREKRVGNFGTDTMFNRLNRLSSSKHVEHELREITMFNGPNRSVIELHGYWLTRQAFL